MATLRMVLFRYFNKILARKMPTKAVDVPVLHGVISVVANIGRDKE